MITDDLPKIGEIGVQVGGAVAAGWFALRALVWAQNMTQATMTQTNTSLRKMVADLETRVAAQQRVIDALRQREREWVEERARMIVRVGRLETQLGITPDEEG